MLTQHNMFLLSFFPETQSLYMRWKCQRRLDVELCYRVDQSFSSFYMPAAATVLAEPL